MKRLSTASTKKSWLFRLPPFSISLRERLNAAGWSKCGQQMTKGPLEKCRVLIVDDDQKVAALLSELLEQEGYEALSVADGGRALQVLNSFDPDVVISDVVMPVI